MNAGGARRPRRAENAHSADQPGEDAGLRPDDSATGLPTLRSWRAVYIAVTVIFVLWVALLTWLTEAYS